MEVPSVIMFCAVLCSMNVMQIVAGNIIIGGPVRSKSSSNDQRSPTIIDSRSGPSQFLAYWNIPTFQCKTKGVLFTDVYKNYGIIQNTDDEFAGEKIVIMYDPGNFPALIEENRKGSYEFRNGGVPQEGNLDLHLKQFREAVIQKIPDENFDGVAVIDFESWRPIFRQNFGILKPYKDESIKLERRRHPIWPDSWIEKEAAKNFEKAGRKFVEQTILRAKEMRPLAKWGYYAYPYCFNMNSQKTPECSSEVVQENNQIQWLWDSTDLLLPSVYFSSKKHNSRERLQMVSGRINEAKRIQSRTRKETNILLYFWYKYQDDSERYLTKDDVYNSLQHMYNQGINGVILWGSSNDVSTKEKCLELREYLDNVLGPVIKEFTQNARVRVTEYEANGNSTTNDELVPEGSEVLDIVVVPEDNDSKQVDKESHVDKLEVLQENEKGKSDEQMANKKEEIIEILSAPQETKTVVIGVAPEIEQLEDAEAVDIPQIEQLLDAEIVTIPEIKRLEDAEILVMPEIRQPEGVDKAVIPEIRRPKGADKAVIPEIWQPEGAEKAAIPESRRMEDVEIVIMPEIVNKLEDAQLVPILQNNESLEVDDATVPEYKKQTNEKHLVYKQPEKENKKINKYDDSTNNETFDTNSSEESLEKISKRFEALLMRARFYSFARPSYIRILEKIK